VPSELGQSHPNPFGSGGGTAAIPFTLGREGHVTLRVFDLSGKQVRVLLEEARGEGEHVVFWDGRNDRGEVAPAGIYLYALDAPGFRATRRMVRIR
jgi:flagellar hook assembly protein FlgD